MWDERALLEHTLRKRETSQIITRIEAKQYLRMRKHHSEGAEVAADYTHQLRHAVRKSKTEKLTFLHHHRQRKKLITMFERPKPNRLPPIQPPMRDAPEQKPKKGLQEEEEEEIGDMEEMPDERRKRDQSSNQSDSDQEQQQKQALRQQQPTKGANYLPSQRQKNNNFLPMLELYVQEQKYLKSMNTQEKRIRNIIVTMMVLAINRRQNGRLLEALDVLLQTQVYFPTGNKEMLHLKSVWLSLIGKIYQQVKSSFKSKSGRDRWKKTIKKSTLKSAIQMKRQKTIFIRSLASRKIFFDKFSENMRKSKLIYESTYMNELKNPHNVKKMENGLRVIANIGGNLAVSFPQPEQMFPDSEGIVNYAIVLVRKDPEANLFPLNYPQSLVGFINRAEYIAKIVKINSFLIPTARCLNFSSALFSHYQPVLCLLTILLVAALLILCLPSRTAVMVVVCLSVLLLLLVSVMMHGATQSSIRQRGNVQQMMDKCCQEWGEEHQLMQAKFTIHAHCDTFLISYPIDIDLSQDDGSSNVIEQSSKQTLEMSRKCSIKLTNQKFVNPLDEVKEDSSDDDELNAQFWRQLQAKTQELPEYGLKQQFQQEIIDESEDQVVSPGLVQWEFQIQQDESNPKEAVD